MKADKEVNMENKKRPGNQELQEILQTVNEQYGQALNKLACGPSDTKESRHNK